MPILFSSSNASSLSEKVLWVDDYVSRADSGLLTPTTKSLGFKTYIPSSAKAVLLLDPVEYLAAFRGQLVNSACSQQPSISSEQPPLPIEQQAVTTELQAQEKQEAESLIRKALGMADPVIMQPPSISVTNGDTNPTPNHTNLTTRKSASLHKNIITKLRPLPLQYVWSVYYEKAGSSSSTTANTSTAANYTDRLSTLASSVPDIGQFYKIFNNIPWSSIQSRNSVHIFRCGVQPLWEDPENLDGGCFTLKVRRQDQGDEKPKRVWEEICLMGCGGELQAALAEAGIRDHVLGMSFSPRLYWVCVSIWLKKGDEKSASIVQKTVLERLSPELRPANESEYYFKKHSEHPGWEEAVGRKKDD
ncbi:hypothetical protein GJ744_010113 [Endocarpon pusillum]|uniref:Translation initiation factor eIF4e n=1 Tax=Endocarpon pusillum TaxID=364733 RepID=A0A8H7AH83_9EURO|nr:hypothetical protein GJ744_010113 [Endocarpon pusillum]